MEIQARDRAADAALKIDGLNARVCQLESLLDIDEGDNFHEVSSRKSGKVALQQQMQKQQIAATETDNQWSAFNEGTEDDEDDADDAPTTPLRTSAAAAEGNTEAQTPEKATAIPKNFLDALAELDDRSEVATFPFVKKKERQKQNKQLKEATWGYSVANSNAGLTPQEDAATPTSVDKTVETEISMDKVEMAKKKKELFGLEQTKKTLMANSQVGNAAEVMRLQSLMDARITKLRHELGCNVKEDC